MYRLTGMWSFNKTRGKFSCGGGYFSSHRVDLYLELTPTIYVRRPAAWSHGDITVKKTSTVIFQNTSPLANASTAMYIPLGKVDLYLEVLGEELVDINLRQIYKNIHRKRVKLDKAITNKVKIYNNQHPKIVPSLHSKVSRK